VVLTKHRISSIGSSSSGDDQISHYLISGLPAGENAMVAEFPDRGWRILRWNDEWHGNWTGEYESAEAALEALRQQVAAAVA